MTENASISSQLPASFTTFLKENDIDPAIYDAPSIANLSRFIRVSLKELHRVMEKRMADEDNSLISIQEIEADIIFQLKTELDFHHITSISMIPHFYSLPWDNCISHCSLYKQGKIHGIDLSSAVAVHLMNIRKNDHILDICCAPGAKLCMMAEYLQEGNGTVTGVDIDEKRITSCRSLLMKTKYKNVRLFKEDGTKFDVRPDSSVYTNKKKRKRDGCSLQYSSFNYQEQKLIFANLYDKVIVDAECTHDGSIQHILKYKHLGWHLFDAKFMDQQRIHHLEVLQRQLIANGFRLLRPGGQLLYCTCSFTRRQNEDIVKWLLDMEETAQLIHIDPTFLSPIDQQQKNPFINIKQDMLSEKCLRMDPIQTGTSGLFIAKIIKLEECRNNSKANKENRLLT